MTWACGLTILLQQLLHPFGVRFGERGGRRLRIVQHASEGAVLVHLLKDLPQIQDDIGVGPGQGNADSRQLRGQRDGPDG